MKLKKFNSNKLINVNINKYRIDWNSKSASSLQKEVKDFLRPFWIGQIVCEEMTIPGSRMRCDFVNFNKKIVIEMSPGQHREYNKFFHKGSRLNYLNQLKRDLMKELWAIANGFKFVDIYEEDLPYLSREWFEKNYGINL